MKHLVRIGQLFRDQRGQAMVEYSTITFAILIGAGFTAFTAKIFPNNQTIVQALYSALQIHVNSIFYALSLAVP